MGENGERVRQGPVFAPNYVTLVQLREKFLLEQEQERKLKEEEDEKERLRQIEIQKEIEIQRQIEIEKQKQKEIEAQNQNQNQYHGPVFAPNYVTLVQLREKFFLEKEEEERRLKEEEEEEKERQKQMEIEKQKQKEEIEAQNQNQNQYHGPVFAANYVTLVQLREKFFLEKEEEERRLKEEEEEKERQKENEGKLVDKGKNKLSVIDGDDGDGMQWGNRYQGERSMSKNRSNVGISVGRSSSSNGGVGGFRRNGDDQGGRNGSVVYRVRVNDGVKGEERRGNRWGGNWRNRRNGGGDNRSGNYVSEGSNEVEKSLQKIGGSGVLEVKDGVEDEGLNETMVAAEGESFEAGKSNGGGKWGRSDRFERNLNRGENVGRKFGGVRTERNVGCYDGGKSSSSKGNEGERSLGKMPESVVLEVKDGVVDEVLNDGMVAVERKTEGESSETGKRNSDSFNRNLNRGENVGQKCGGVRMERNVVCYDGSKSSSSKGNEGGQSLGKMPESEVLEDGAELDDGYVVTVRIPVEILNDHNEQENSGVRGSGMLFGGVSSGNQTMCSERNVVFYSSSAGSETKAEVHGVEGNSEKVEESDILEVGVKLDSLEVADAVPEAELNVKNMAVEDKNKAESSEGHMAEVGQVRKGRGNFRRNWNKGRKFGHSGFGGGRSGNVTSRTEADVVPMTSASSGSKAEVHEFEANEGERNSEDIRGGEALVVGGLKVTDNVREEGLNENNMAVENKNNAESSKTHMAKHGIEGKDRNEFSRNWNQGGSRGNGGGKPGRFGVAGGRSGNVRLRAEENLVGPMNSASSGSKAKVHEFEANEGEQNSEEMQGGEALVDGVKLDGLKVTDNVQEEGLNENTMVVEKKNNAETESSKAHMAEDGIRGEGGNEFRRNWNNDGNVGRKLGHSGYGGWGSGNVRVRTIAKVYGSMNSASLGSKSVHKFMGNAEGENSEKVTESEVPEVGSELDNIEAMNNVQEGELDENNMAVENKNKTGSSDVDRAKDGKKREYSFRRNYWNGGGNAGRNFGRPAFGCPRRAFGYRDSGPTRQTKQRDSHVVWVKREERPGGANDAEAGSSGTH